MALNGGHRIPRTIRWIQANLTKIRQMPEKRKMHDRLQLFLHEIEIRGSEKEQ